MEDYLNNPNNFNETIIVATLPDQKVDLSDDKPTLATVPDSIGDCNTTNTTTKSLNMVMYSAKSFIVFGDSTRIHKESLKALGGKYNGRLKVKPGFNGGPGWIYPINLNSKVSEFVNKVNTNVSLTQQNIPLQGSSNSCDLPTVIVPVQNKKYQTVKWKVYVPITGMGVTVKADGNEIKGTVLQTETNKDFIDTVYIEIGGNTSKLVICNGKWTVWGYMVEHTVFFETKN